MKKVLSSTYPLILLMLLCISSMAQTNNYAVTLPEVLPASPEPWAFVKAGLGNTNMSTGAVSAKIPLYDIKLRDFTFPIFLSYSTQGLKADEASSRVGYGWVLNANAMITRSVRGKPDEMTLRRPMLTDWYANVDSVYNYYMDMSNPNSMYDSQPDEFSFSCNGYSGKFVLDNNFIPRMTSTSNVKIEVGGGFVPSTSSSIGPFYITTPDGVRFKFGETYERTTSNNLMFNSAFKLVTRTAFFLNSITLPSGDFINFQYSPIALNVRTGVTQTLQVAKQGGRQECGDCESRNSYTTQINSVNYQSHYLTGITTSSGQWLSFDYENQTDLTGDVRLKGFIVSGLKEFRFNYYDVPGTGVGKPLGRFFLTRVRQINYDATESGTDTSFDYSLTYNQLDKVPLPITFAQDYLGFYNGQTGNNYLIPPSVNSSNTIDISHRSFNTTETMKGALVEIKYPTGGREEFVYEANTSGRYQVNKRAFYVDLYRAGIGYATYTYDNIEVHKDQVGTLMATAVDADPNDGYLEDPGHNTVVLKLFDESTSTLITTVTLMGLTTNNVNVNLLAGHNYKLELTVKGSINWGNGTLHYDNSWTDIYDTVYVETSLPGIRVKQINYSSPGTFGNYSKYFKYASLTDLQMSTGLEYLNSIFHSTSVSKNFCGDFGAYETHCLLDIYSSNTASDVYGSVGSGSLIYYTSVIESDDPNFANGGTQYNFFPNEMGGNQVSLHGGDIPYLPQGQAPTLSGEVSSKWIFNKDKQIVEKEENEYETLYYSDPTVYSVFVRKNWEPFPDRPDILEPFDATRTHYANWWIRRKSKTNTNYAGGGTSISKTDYQYGLPVNIQPTFLVTTNSKGEQVKTETRYPTDFPSNPVMAKLVRKNIVAPVIEQSLYKSGTVMQKKQVTYRDWFGDSTIVLPDTIKTKLTPAASLETDLVFAKYDTRGNIKELKKESNIPVAYLWDTIRAVPVCEVKNATVQQFAYAGFEDGTGLGGWQLNSGSASEGTAFTGMYDFTGSISWTVAVAGTYTVQLWAKGSVTVNGATGKNLRSARGWTLYEWSLTNPSSVAVSGTHIDDVRLYPQNAMMKTFTYKPFVGVTSQTNELGIASYFEYDNMLRLLMVRDIDSNIIKRYKYEFVPQESATATWQPTGATRCKPCASNPLYSSTIQEREEKDINQTSSTYNQLRWVETGASGSCSANAVWQNTTTTPRCVKDGQNNNTGGREQEQKDVNPCSLTYNQTRWITISSDENACPLPCPGCNTIDKKCINGVCETGILDFVSSVQVNGYTWHCTWRYKFSDLTYSANFVIVSSGHCEVD
ncbi:hypothetical protein [Paraflavitalea sp. CAU 1676]|uniref:hypothetical protein n=1 Tax=Paraflavitalea sp. CAU 1676 TaxID=3032598 RepID=UPI0023DAA319|nr:hypothetical protein [Paraflavitalea sp. CAU 1676]MDF2189978.1 hypothetical protein [Paraflavitalea sp. CAU 1676]